MSVLLRATASLLVLVSLPALADGDAAEPPVGACNDDNLFIMYTSGTTGRPKGVVGSGKGKGRGG